MAFTIPDRGAVAAHVEASLAAAPIGTDPFPHLVVARVLPDDFYTSLIAALPPATCFTGAHVKPNWRFTPDGVPEDGFRLWRFFAEDVVPSMLVPGVVNRFAAHIPDVPLGHSDVRMLLRRPGYRIRPHLDPGKSFVTTLFYLARPGEPEAYGTDLYRTEDQAPGTRERTFYPEDDSVRYALATTIPFRANTALVFANVGLHGAQIPPDAPLDLERYAVQFYVGPAAAAPGIAAADGQDAY